MKRFWRIFRGVLLPLGVLLAVAAGAAAAWTYSGEVRTRARAAWRGALEWAGLSDRPAEAGQIYWCPMDPEIKRTKPNELCPICNMALVPLDESDMGSSAEGLVLTTRQVQQAGVVTEPVRPRRLEREIDTTGRLDYDERLLRTVTSRVKGKSRIDKLHVRFLGDYVEKGKLLAEVYSPELISAQEELLIALSGPSSGSLVEAAKQKLQYWGMTPEQVEELVRRRKPRDSVSVYAPISGTVIKPPVREGQYVNEGEALFHLADLSRLWLFADIYEEELPLVKLGQKADLFIRGLPKEDFTGTVAFIDPMVQRDTRTVRVRIEVENERVRTPAEGERPPAWKLKPGMYARVRLQAKLPEVLAVPENAVLWSGRRRVVIVKEGEGLFRPREVRLGQKWVYPHAEQPREDKKLDFGADDQRYHEVLAGLYPGEEVVTAGAFLLNAESQFQSVLTKMLPPESETIMLAELLGRPLAERVRGVLDAYYKLSQALADDYLAAVPDRATALAEAAEALRRQAEEEKNESLASAARRLALLARDVAEPVPKDLHAARFGFGRVSQSLIRLLAENGGQTLFGEELFLFRCGMSKVGYENWLWFSKEKLNPYMGKKMLDCGSELKVLKP